MKAAAQVHQARVGEKKTRYLPGLTVKIDDVDDPAALPNMPKPAPFAAPLPLPSADAATAQDSGLVSRGRRKVSRCVA